MRQIASPNPMPCDFVVKNASNMLPNCFGSNPGPESSTATIIAFGLCSLVLTCRNRSRSVVESIASIAFWTKFEMTCCNCLLWPATGGSPDASSARVATLCSANSPREDCSTSCAISLIYLSTAVSDPPVGTRQGCYRTLRSRDGSRLLSCPDLPSPRQCRPAP